MLDFRQFDAISFDCYGTLIDWESGLLPPLRALLATYGVSQTDDQILALYARLEAAAEQGPYSPYRDVLRRVVQGVGLALGFSPTRAEQDGLPDSLAHWPAFPDTAGALRRLKPQHRLAIISNTDDVLFAQTAPVLGVEFDCVTTAQQVGAYKPDRRLFEMALARLGVPADRLLHVGQSVYHDVIPARALGIATVLVTRRGPGATLPTRAEADLTVPDLETLASLVEAG